METYQDRDPGPLETLAISTRRLFGEGTNDDLSGGFSVSAVATPTNAPAAISNTSVRSAPSTPLKEPSESVSETGSSLSPDLQTKGLSSFGTAFTRFFKRTIKRLQENYIKQKPSTATQSDDSYLAKLDHFGSVFENLKAFLTGNPSLDSIADMLPKFGCSGTVRIETESDDAADDVSTSTTTPDDHFISRAFVAPTVILRGLEITKWLTGRWTINDQPTEKRQGKLRSETEARDECKLCGQVIYRSEMLDHRFSCARDLESSIHDMETLLANRGYSSFPKSGESLEEFAQRQYEYNGPILRKAIEEGLSTFVGGPAGSGKTAFTKRMLGEMGYVEDEVLILAHQGCAAHNIGGQTFDSVFRMPPIRESGSSLKETNDAFREACFDLFYKEKDKKGGTQLKQLYEKHKKVKVIVLEEISMFSVFNLWYLKHLAKAFFDERVRDARRNPQTSEKPHYNRQNPFKDISVVMLGDFIQLATLERFRHVAESPAYAFFFEEINSLVPISLYFNWRTKNSRKFGNFLFDISRDKFNRAAFLSLGFKLVSTDAWAKVCDKYTLITQNKPGNARYRAYEEKLQTSQKPILSKYFEVVRDKTSGGTSESGLLRSGVDESVRRFVRERTPGVDFHALEGWLSAQNSNFRLVRHMDTRAITADNTYDLHRLTFQVSVIPDREGPELLYSVLPSPSGCVMVTLNNSAFCLSDNGKSKIANGHVVEIKEVMDECLYFVFEDKEWIMPRITRFRNRCSYVCSGFPICSSQIISAFKSQGLTITNAALDFDTIPFDTKLTTLMFSRGSDPKHMLIVSDAFDTIEDLANHMHANQHLWFAQPQACIAFMEQLRTQPALTFNPSIYFESVDSGDVPGMVLSSQSTDFWNHKIRAPYRTTGNAKRKDEYGDTKVDIKREGEALYQALGVFDIENCLQRKCLETGVMETYSIGIYILWSKKVLNLRKQSASQPGFEPLAKWQKFDRNNNPGLILIRRGLKDPPNFCETEFLKLVLELKILTYTHFTTKCTSNTVSLDAYRCFHFYGFNSSSFDVIPFIKELLESDVWRTSKLPFNIVPNVGAANTFIYLSHNLQVPKATKNGTDTLHVLKPFIKFLDLKRIYGIPGIGLGKLHGSVQAALSNALVLKEEVSPQAYAQAFPTSTIGTDHNKSVKLTVWEKEQYREYWRERYFIPDFDSFLLEALKDANDGSKGELPHEYISEKGYEATLEDKEVRIPGRYFQSDLETDFLSDKTQKLVTAARRMNLRRAHDEYLERDVLITMLVAVFFNYFTMKQCEHSLITFSTMQSMTTGLFLYKSYRSQNGFTKRMVVKDKLGLTPGQVVFTSNSPTYPPVEQELVKSSIYGGKVLPRKRFDQAKCEKYVSALTKARSGYANEESFTKSESNGKRRGGSASTATSKSAKTHLERECQIFEGVCYVHNKSKADRRTCHGFFDISGMYAYCLQYGLFPYGKKVYTRDPAICIMFEKFISSSSPDIVENPTLSSGPLKYFFIAEVVRHDNPRCLEVSVPHKKTTYPDANDNSIKFTSLAWEPMRHDTQALNNVDIANVLRDGSKISRVNAVTYWEEADRIYEDYISFLNDSRDKEKAAGNGAMEQMFKVLSNATYGATLKQDRNDVRLVLDPGDVLEAISKLEAYEAKMSSNGQWIITGKSKVAASDLSSRSIHLGSFVLGYSRSLLQFLDLNSSDRPTDFSDDGLKRRFASLIKYGDTDSIVIPVQRVENALAHDLRQLEAGKKWLMDTCLSRYPEVYGVVAKEGRSTWTEYLQALSDVLNRPSSTPEAPRYNDRYVYADLRRELVLKFPLVLSYRGTYQTKGSLEEDLVGKYKFTLEEFQAGYMSLISSMTLCAPKLYSMEYMAPVVVNGTLSQNGPVVKYKIRGKGMPKYSRLTLEGLPAEDPDELFFERGFKPHQKFFTSPGERGQVAIMFTESAGVHQMMVRMAKDPGVSIVSVKTGFKMTPTNSSGDQLIFEDDDGDYVATEAPSSSILKRSLVRNVGTGFWRGRREPTKEERIFFDCDKYVTLPHHFSLES